MTSPSRTARCSGPRGWPGDRLGQGTHEPREAGEPPAERRHQGRIRTQHHDRLLQRVCWLLARWYGWSARQK